MNKKYSLVILSCFFYLTLTLGLTSIALSKDLYVPKEYHSIRQAVEAASSGDRILVAEGTYLEQVRLKPGLTLEGGWNKQYTQRDKNKYLTIIDGQGKEGWVVLAADKIILDGFHVRNGTQVKSEKEEYGSGIYCLSVRDVIIRHNTFYQNEPSGIYVGNSKVTITQNHIIKNAKAGIHLDKGATALIESNIIEENKDAGISSKSQLPCQAEIRWNRIFKNGRGGIDGQKATGKVYNNIIYENLDAGVRAHIAPLEVINNTIIANTQSGVIADDPNQIIVIKNNIITLNEESGVMSATKGYSYNLLFANTKNEGCDPNCLPCIRSQHAGYEDEESFRKIGHIIADPQFIDPNGHDYHLSPGSPAIDAGDNDSMYNDKNFPPSLGNDRNDLGAYGGPFTLAEEKTKANQSPVAKIKVNSPLYTGEVVRLEGMESKDPDGDQLIYNWQLISSPSGSKARLLKPENSKTSFRPDLPGEYKITLNLSDRWGAKAETSTIINVPRNHPPSAYAGEDLEQVSVGDTIQLFGDVSSDDDRDTLAYRWQVVAGPKKSQCRLSNPSSASPILAIDQPGCYILQLIVNDGQTDSQPAKILVNTVYDAVNKTRHVPSEYPTIQGAIDAAQPGDTILVEAGTYVENIFIEKPLNLTGINWPVIDGGSQPGNVDTVKISYLGDKAGKIEGFVITGGGSGLLGHGLSAWDSSPVICNNQFVRNPNNGIGIHGRQLLTEKADVYGNIVYENKGGIGNGRGGCGRIHHNYIFRNKVFGVGCRGFSSPRIEYNHIFENSIGIGMREVSSPNVTGNYIYKNENGIVFSPVSTVKNSVGEDMIIHNNLIFQNRENGIMVTSFNLSKVIITNNTIDGNNKESKSRRGGGIILGWPWPGQFEAIVQNNIISNNGGIGLMNYPGAEENEEVDSRENPENVANNPEDAIKKSPEGSVKITSSHNNLWQNKENYKGCDPGQKDLSQDPQFTAVGKEPWQAYKDSLKADAEGIDIGFSYHPDEVGKKLPPLPSF